MTTEDTTVKPRTSFDVNFGTLIPILTAITVSYGALQIQVNRMDERSVGRIKIADTFQAETKAKLDAIADNPMRIKALEEQNKATNARLDRLADVIVNGQDQLRRDLAATVEPLRKDIQTVGTKVEVLSERLGERLGARNPQPTSFQP